MKDLTTKIKRTNWTIEQYFKELYRRSLIGDNSSISEVYQEAAQRFGLHATGVHTIIAYPSQGFGRVVGYGTIEESPVAHSFSRQINHTLSQNHTSPMWVYDDARTGRMHEAFVGGTSEVITAYAMRKGFDVTRPLELRFSNEKFPRSDFTFKQVKDKEPSVGTSYVWVEGPSMGIPKEACVGWLCPALLDYFKSPPIHIFAKIEQAV